jgi:hypothetical protein
MIELAGPVHVLAGITNRLVFSPDEQRLAVTYAAAVPGKDQTQGEYSLAQIDLDRQVIDQVVKLTGMPRFVGYSADGRSLIVYAVSYHRENGTAQPGTPQVSRYRAADLSLEWQVDLPGVRDGQFWTDTGHAPAAEYWQPALVFAAEANRLYIVHADTDQLTTVDPVAQSVETVEIKASQTWLDRVLARTATVAYAKVLLGVTREAVLSPVEDRLYIISSVYEESGWSIPAGMQILNPATGQILTDYETEATDLVLDQGRLYLYRQTEAGYWTEILDADNLEAIMSRRDQLIRPARL